MIAKLLGCGVKLLLTACEEGTHLTNFYFSTYFRFRQLLRPTAVVVYICSQAMSERWDRKQSTPLNNHGSVTISTPGS